MNEVYYHIPISVDNLKRCGFSFDERYLSLHRVLMFIFWDEPNGQTNIQIWPRDLSHDCGVWMCKIERPLNNMLVEVREISDIQRCMACANIERKIKLNDR